MSNVISKTWFPDDCALDCNENGVPDECELEGNDCNGNGIHDACDVECPAECLNDEDCELDGDLCTIDSCAQGVCIQAVVDCPEGLVCLPETGECGE